MPASAVTVASPVGVWSLRKLLIVLLVVSPLLSFPFSSDSVGNDSVVINIIINIEV